MAKEDKPRWLRGHRARVRDALTHGNYDRVSQALRHTQGRMTHQRLVKRGQRRQDADMKPLFRTRRADSRSAFDETLNRTIAEMIDAISEKDEVQGTRAYLDLILIEQQILSADRAGQRLVTATYVLAVSTLVLVAATFALVIKTP